MKTSRKTVNLDLTTIDGNAFYLIGAFRRQARKEGWTSDEISAVTQKCISGNYDHLLRVLMDVCEPRGEE